MKYLAYICSFMLLLHFACNRQGNQGLRTKKASTFLLGKHQHDSIKWRLIQTYDPYDGGNITRRDSLNPRFLVFGRDGEFKQYDNLNYVVGKWHLNRAKTALAFVNEERNGKEIAGATETIPSFRHQIRKHTTDTMILAWQGRHGFVEELYTIVRDSVQPANLTPAKSNTP